MTDTADAMRRYLATLRERSGLSWADLSAMTGLPDSTIRKVFSGETADPRLETISLIVDAMGGSLDTMMNGEEQQQAAESAREDANVSAGVDTGDAVRADYERRIEDLKASFTEYAASLRRDKRILGVVAAVLGLLLFIFMVLDLVFGSVGWIRY